MHHLRAMFEEQLEIRIEKDGSAMIGGTPFTPASILRSDQTAYETEFNAWLSDRWLPDQEERLDEILSQHGNHKRFNDLCMAIKNGQVVPFVGSGMSVPTGLLIWSDFLRSLRKYSKLPHEELEALLN